MIQTDFGWGESSLQVFLIWILCRFHGPNSSSVGFNRTLGFSVSVGFRA